MLSLEEYAALRVAIERRGARDSVLREAKVLVREWLAAQRHWLGAIAAEVSGGHQALAARYLEAYRSGSGAAKGAALAVAPLPARPVLVPSYLASKPASALVASPAPVRFAEPVATPLVAPPAPVVAQREMHPQAAAAVPASTTAPVLKIPARASLPFVPSVAATPVGSSVVDLHASATSTPSADVGNMRFRMLELVVTLKSGLFTSAKVASDMSHTLPNKAKTVHGAVLREDAKTLWVDYKPDFVQIANKTAKQKAKRPSEKNDKKKKPSLMNLFIHLHHTEGPTPGSALEDFINRTIKGAHYLVDVDGFVVKLTDESFRANHAGKAHWYDLDSGKVGNTVAVFNDLSVGIEQVNEDGDAYPANQASATSELVGRLRKSLGIPKHNVLADGETALNFDDKKTQKSLGRKVKCPGPTYPWSVLEKAGNATAPAATATVPAARYDNFFVTHSKGSIDASSTSAAIDGLQQTLSELGYFVNLNSKLDNAAERAVEAFQNRYFSGPDRAKQLAAVKGQKNRPLANLATVTRMHAVLDARAGFEYE